MTNSAEPSELGSVPSVTMTVLYESSIRASGPQSSDELCGGWHTTVASLRIVLYSERAKLDNSPIRIVNKSRQLVCPRQNF